MPFTVHGLCYHRSQSILNHMERAEVARLLARVQMHDPQNAEQRQKLAETVKLLNDQFALGLSLDDPRSTDRLLSAPSALPSPRGQQG
jgi:hypothetical protein